MPARSFHAVYGQFGPENKTVFANSFRGNRQSSLLACVESIGRAFEHREIIVSRINIESEYRKSQFTANNETCGNLEGVDRSK